MNKTYLEYNKEKYRTESLLSGRSLLNFMQVLLSVIIPAYNEAENISTCINSVKTALAGLPTAAEVIVVDNASTDRTTEIAGKLGCRVVHEPFRQIARARNAGAAAAAGEFLVFLDADTAISPGMLAEVVRLLKTGRIAGGGARIEFDAPTSFLAGALLRFWQAVSRGARFAAGCFVFCTATAFKKAGGFDERVFASEEIGFSRRIRAAAVREGQKFVIIDQPGIKTSARKNQQLARMILTMLIIALFPPAVRFRSLCFFWYNCRK